MNKRIMSISEFYEYLQDNPDDPECQKVFAELPPHMQLKAFARYSKAHTYTSQKPNPVSHELLQDMLRELNEQAFLGSKSTLELSPTQYQVVKKEEQDDKD